MGVFSDFAPDYLAHGIPVFPTGGDDGKKALVRNYQKMGVPASRKLLEGARFDGANLAFMCGRWNRVTVLDVDTPDRTAFDRVVSECGDTAIKIQTGSGKFQAWYRHNGEHRKIRPIEGEAIDVLGGGMVIAPPSVRPDLDGKAYRFLEGSLDDVDWLLPIRRGALPPEVYGKNEAGKQAADGNRVFEGERGEAFFRWAMKESLSCETEAELLFRASAWNEANYEPPLPESRVADAVGSAWGYRERNSVWIGKEARAIITISELDTLGGNADSAFLLMKLRATHGWREGKGFALSKAFAASLGWTLRRFYAARGFLGESGFIECLHPGGNGPNDPPIYRME